MVENYKKREGKVYAFPDTRRGSGKYVSVRKLSYAEAGMILENCLKRSKTDLLARTKMDLQLILRIRKRDFSTILQSDYKHNFATTKSVLNSINNDGVSIPSPYHEKVRVAIWRLKNNNLAGHEAGEDNLVGRMHQGICRIRLKNAYLLILYLTKYANYRAISLFAIVYEVFTRVCVSD